MFVFHFRHRIVDNATGRKSSDNSRLVYQGRYKSFDDHPIYALLPFLFMVAFSCVAGQIFIRREGRVRWGGRKAVASANDKSYEASKQKGVIYKEESRSRLCPAPPLLFIQESAKAARYKHTRAPTRTLCAYSQTLYTERRVPLASRVEFNYQDLKSSLHTLARWLDKTRSTIILYSFGIRQKECPPPPFFLYSLRSSASSLCRYHTPVSPSRTRHRFSRSLLLFVSLFFFSPGALSVLGL